MVRQFHHLRAMCIMMLGEKTVTSSLQRKKEQNLPFVFNVVILNQSDVTIYPIRLFNYDFSKFVRPRDQMIFSNVTLSQVTIYPSDSVTVVPRLHNEP